jgi:hypothetical protein
MKKLFLLIIPALSVIVSCNTGPKEVDDRPATELALIKKFSEADSTLTAQINDANKEAFFTEVKPKLVNFIIKDLNCKAENWEAHVYEIKPGENGINATFLISKEPTFGDEKYPQYSSIVLESNDVSDDNLVKTLRTLQQGDKVILSGTIEKINFDVDNTEFFQTSNHFHVNKDFQISNPAFYFTLSALKHKEKP